MAANDVQSSPERIADQAALEQFSRQPANERKLTDSLRGVLAETACTGVIRYEWPLLRELVVHQLEVQLKQFEAAESVEVGPARPLGSGDSDVAATVNRFTGLLGQFQGSPWTLQRLCELILEPRKQYQRLHKLILALEKLLLVTGEVDSTHPLPPVPRLDQLTAVNDTPGTAPAASGNSLAGQKRSRPEDAEASGLVTASLKVTARPGHVQAAAGDPAPAAAEAAAAGVREDKENDSRKQAVASTAADAPKQILQESQQEAAAADEAAGPSVTMNLSAPTAADNSTGATDPAAAAGSEPPVAADTGAADVAVGST
eukprot:GHUV01009706.1.p1 GENE.GHUV01009706.1~~GHUV01009706.1.p1  ORF type:complete len:316 (+),score=119.92 GHUV01009706.1:236-1183(+)